MNLNWTQHEVICELQGEIMQAIDKVKALEADSKAAQAKCAEMREALEACDNYLAGACQPTNRAIVRHALSGDCGKGYIHVRELDGVIEFLSDIESKTSPESRWARVSLIKLSQVRARLEALRNGERLK